MLVWACIAPHGGELIPELANGNLARMAVTRAAMEEMERRCREAAPDVMVVYTPHGLYVPGHMCISVTRQTAGVLDGESGERVFAQFEIDQSFAAALAERASQAGIPVVLAAVGEDGEPAALLPLDWGALIPLWFLGARWGNPPRVVVVCPGRELDRDQLMEFGRLTAEVAADAEARVAIVCSADQGHGHAADGPYGFAENSAAYDAAYREAVRQNALDRLLEWDDEWIESALPDSYWQTLILHGALLHTPLQPDLLSYEAPTYFGMLCAEYAADRRESGGA